MEAKLLIACTRRLHPLEAMYITFKKGKDGIAGLTRLLGLTRSNQKIRIEGGVGETLSIQAVISSGDWDRVSRTFMLWGMNTAQAEFLEPMARDIESVATGDHLGKALFTTNQRRREEAVAKLWRQVVGPGNLQKEIENWGLGLFADGKTVDELFGIEFTVRDLDHKVVLSIMLDGWSGQVSIDEGPWGGRRYLDANQLGQRIAVEFAAYLERATSAATP
jgi:hypothetical protein